MPLANRTRAGRRDCGGGAPFCAALRAALCAMRSRKRPCQPKTAKRIFGGPGSQGPSGQAKERMRVLPARRDLLRLACRAVCRGWLFLRGLPLLCGILRPVSRRVFPAAALAAVREAFCNRVRLLRRCFPAHTPPAAFAPGLRCPRGLLVVCPLCAEGTGFLLLFFTRSPRKALPFLPVFRGFVPGLHILPPAAFSRTFAPIACLPVLRCLCELSLVFLPFPA